MSFFSKLFGRKNNSDSFKEEETVSAETQEAAEEKSSAGSETAKKSEETKSETKSAEPSKAENKPETKWDELDDEPGDDEKAEEPEKAEDTAGEEHKTEERLDVYHLIVLDESGSMSCVRRQTISGCNETIQTVRQMQKNNPDQRHYVSVYVFKTGNNRYIIRNKPVENVMEITAADYSPDSCTPLYDALGKTLTELRSLINEKHTLGYVTVITDGMENDSRRYDLKNVLALIDELKKQDVIFTFIGANIDAAECGQALHINNTMQFEQTENGTEEMWKRERMAQMRSNAQYRFRKRYMADSDDFDKFSEYGNRGNFYEFEENSQRFTPEHIKNLKENEVFVFGSNVDGNHNGGAAAFAVSKFGAVMGQAEGLQGQSYAIVTTGVSEKEMYNSIKRFCKFAKEHPELTFLVTAVGCGNGGYSPYIVGPMFEDAAKLPNVKLPRTFWNVSSADLQY